MTNGQGHRLKHCVPRRLFCSGSLMVLDVCVCGYVLLVLLDIKIENR